MDDNDELQVPTSIHFDSQIFQIDFHPNRNLVASGLITGQILCLDENKLELEINIHKKSIRDFYFENETTLISSSSDKSIRSFDICTNKLNYKLLKAHDDPVNVLVSLGENTIASGDDSGVIRIWDKRTKEFQQEYKECTDFISDMKFVSYKKTLLASSGDGALSVFDIRKPKLFARSEYYEDDLLSLALMKSNKKVVAGSQLGMLNVFSWGLWGDVSDRFPGHPLSIDALCPYDDDILFTGSSDGLIRAIEISPNNFLGVVGQHDYPIESLKLDHEKKYLASCSHDQTISFWSVEDFGNSEEVQKKIVVEESKPKKSKKMKLEKNERKAEDAKEFFADLD